MNIATVIPGYLYAVDQVLPPQLLSLIAQIDWPARSARQLDIGQGLRRQIEYSDSTDRTVNNYCFTQLKQAIEQACCIKFTGRPAEESAQYWLDLPGFRPAMHTDGDLPSAVQIYLQSADRTDLGTAFYPEGIKLDDADHYRLIHTGADPVYPAPLHVFASKPNSGYVMLNQPEPNRPELWHDMTQAVPKGMLRLCLYVTLGPYQRL
jgi:hypothetical protein